MELVLPTPFTQPCHDTNEETEGVGAGRGVKKLIQDHLAMTK